MCVGQVHDAEPPSRGGGERCGKYGHDEGDQSVGLKRGQLLDHLVEQFRAHRERDYIEFGVGSKRPTVLPVRVLAWPRADRIGHA